MGSVPSRRRWLREGRIMIQGSGESAERALLRGVERFDGAGIADRFAEPVGRRNAGALEVGRVVQVDGDELGWLRDGVELRVGVLERPGQDRRLGEPLAGDLVLPEGRVPAAAAGRVAFLPVIFALGRHDDELVADGERLGLTGRGRVLREIGAESRKLPVVEFAVVGIQRGERGLQVREEHPGEVGLRDLFHGRRRFFRGPVLVDLVAHEGEDREEQEEGDGSHDFRFS